MRTQSLQNKLVIIWVHFGLFAACASVAINLPGIPTVFSEDNQVTSEIADDIVAIFEREYLDYWKTGIESVRLKQISIQLANAHSRKDIFTKNLPELNAADQFVTCVLCRATVNVFVRTVRDENGELNGENGKDQLAIMALDMCTRFNLQTEEVCNGLIQFNIDTIDHILRNSDIDSTTFCSLFMQFNFCNTVTNVNYNWTLTIDNTGPEVTDHKSNTPKPNEGDLKFCQITDIHYDPLYEPGSLAACAEPLCCQRNKTIYEGTAEAAGYWGDYRDCDTPWHTLESALDNIIQNHKCDFVIQTGDIVSHMVWDTSTEKNSDVLTKVSQRLNEAFGNVPIYPCIGNHEPHPLNLFSPSDAPNGINTKWLYEHLYNIWSKWLPPSTKETILQGGYYTVSPRQGYRIIALNSNDCYTKNLWLYYNGVNKKPQLQWLHDTLLEAEKAGEYVHIISHIPTGDGNCWSVWAREYNRLIERFSATISGIFNGHSHRDEFNVHYSNKGYATAVAWNGGALTTYSYKNPNYRIYDVNPNSYQVTNHRTYIFNLTEANLNPGKQPEWYEEYDFIKEFTDDISPLGLHQLLDNFADKPDVLRKYWRFRVTTADPFINAGCGRACLAEILCRAATSVYSETDRCNELRERLYYALDVEGGVSTTEGTSPQPTEAPSTTVKPDGGGTSAILAFNIIIILMISYASKCIF